MAVAGFTRRQGLADRQLASAFAWVSAQIGHEPRPSQSSRALQIPGLASVSQCRLHVDAMTLLERTGHYDRAFDHMRLANDPAGGSFDPQGLIPTRFPGGSIISPRRRCNPSPACCAWQPQADLYHRHAAIGHVPHRAARQSSRSLRRRRASLMSDVVKFLCSGSRGR